MKLIDLQTLEYPVTIYQIRAQNSQISYPNNPDYIPDGYAVVHSSTFPEHDRNHQKFIELPPYQQNGIWKQAWQVVDLTTEEQQKIRESKETEVKKRRNSLLLQSDWTQVADAPVDRNAWVGYRQQLRDIPSQPGFPFDVVWPAAPQN